MSEYRRSFKSSTGQNRYGGGMLIGLFIGLVIGILIAFGVVWYLNKAPLPFLDHASRPERPEANAAAANQAPLPLPGKPGDAVDDKPRFEFYKILPGGEDAMPAPAAPPALQQAPQRAPQQAPAQVANPGPAGAAFYLQAGSFQKSAEADNLKARLAMMGFDTTVQEIHLPDKGVMSRVRLGPFGTQEEMNRVRSQLAQNGIQATVVKPGSGTQPPQ